METASPLLVAGPTTTRLTVTVPNNIRGGELVRVSAPDGNYHSVMVPNGLSPGQQFSIELLAVAAEWADAQTLKVNMTRFCPHISIEIHNLTCLFLSLSPPLSFPPLVAG